MGWLVEQAAEFLCGAGRRVAVNFVRRAGLPADLADDLVQDALLRARDAEQRGDAPDNVEAFVTTLVQRAGIDLLRGHRRRPEGHLLAGTSFDDAIEELPAATTDAPELDVLASDDLARVRARLGGRLSDEPAAAAAGLAVLSMRLGGAGPADDVPQPKAGAGENEAVEWAGLFYAGCHDCFPGRGKRGEPAAVRQRRSRAVGKMRRVLEEAAVEAGVLPGGDDG